jgi:hypothetical protein
MVERSPRLSCCRQQQHDPNALTRLLQTLEYGMVEIQRATGPFRADGRAYSEGDYVIAMAQPYGRFAKTLLEKQQYPVSAIIQAGRRSALTT